MSGPRPADLVEEILSTHHALLHAELPRLDAAAETMPDPLADTWMALSTLLQDHLVKEEQVLFPAILRLAEGGPPGHCGLEGPLTQMAAEHEQIESLVEVLLELAPGAGDDAELLVRVLEDLAVHARKEEEQLFPGARALLSAPGLLAMLARLDSEHVTLRDGFARWKEALEQDGTSPAVLDRFHEFHARLVAHLDEEESQLLPALHALAAGEPPPESGFERFLADLGSEYAEVEAFSEGLRRIVDRTGGEDGELIELLDRLEAHSRWEEDVLFPAAMHLVELWGPRGRGCGGTSVGSPQASPWVLRRTTSTCPECLMSLPADVVVHADRVTLERTCPTDGLSVQLLSRSPAYWVDLDRYYFRVNPGAWPQRDYIVRMTEKCNLNCPICLARANDSDAADLDLGALKRLLADEDRGRLKIDLMAAEPTLREDLAQIVRDVKAAGHIAALHTNGLKLAKLDYARRMAAAGVDEVFLQFDGFDEDANRALRGRPLVKARLKTLRNLRQVGLRTSLVTVIAKGVNEDQAGEVYRFALRPENDHIREVLLLGLRELGSARDADLSDNALMPDELIDLLSSQDEGIHREDVRRFNKLYFAALSAFRVRKCLYVQHYLVARDGKGGAIPAAEFLDMARLETAAERYADDLDGNQVVARARLLASIGRSSLVPQTLRSIPDLVRMQQLLRKGFNLRLVPRRFLLLGFITACDPLNFDSQVALNCGKGELSEDGGLTDSGALANVLREQRVAQGRR